MTRKNIFAFLVLLLVLTPTFVLAQPGNPGGTKITVSIPNPFKCNQAAGECTLMGLITAILNNIILPIATVFVIIWIVYAGFQFVTAQGKPTAIDEARRNLLWSLIGAGILLGAAGISKVLQNTVDALIVP